MGGITKQYKIVFCDIDGTLIDSHNRLSAATVHKIQELSAINIPFVLVSARMPSGILHIQRKLGIKAPIICYSGALVLNDKGENVKSTGIEREKAVCVNEFINYGRYDVCCNVFSYNGWIVDDINNKWVVNERDITTSVPTEGKITDFLPQDGYVHKFLCMGEAEKISDLDNAIKTRFPELSVCRSKDTYLEIMEGGVSKSGAVLYLCGQYGISASEAVSFGDNFNDADMLLTTGMSFAMGNAPEEVKKLAARIAPDNDSEGVLAGLTQLNFTGL